MTRRARQDRPVSPWGLLILMTFFQILTCIQLILSTGDKAHPALPLIFVGMTALMWVYCLTLRAFRRVGFEMEIIAFFLCTHQPCGHGLLCPSLGAPSNSFPLCWAWLDFLILGWFLRDLQRANLLRRPMAVIAVLLLAATLVFGSA